MIIVKAALQALLALLVSTLVFDVVHFLLHKFARSQYGLLRLIARLHLAHHRFFSPTLKIDVSWSQKNIFYHVFMEFLVRGVGILACAFFLDFSAILIALTFNILHLLVVVFYYQGIDGHHKPLERVKPCSSGFWVSHAYHALHHVYPNNYFGSLIKCIDYVLGTGCQLKGKRIAMTGASGALGSSMKILLEQEGALITTFKYGLDYTYDQYEKLKAPLSNTDILLLCHGSKYENAQQANCESFVSIIELYKSVHQHKILVPEVWGVGSEIECHPCFGNQKLVPYAKSKRNYSRYARKYFHDKHIQYRHIVHSAFTSNMGSGFMSAGFAAKVTLQLIKRGFKYIPVTYTGFAFINYFRYMKLSRISPFWK